MAFLGAFGDQLYAQLENDDDHRQQLNYCLLTIDYHRRDDMIARAAKCLTIAIDHLTSSNNDDDNVVESSNNRRRRDSSDSTTIHYDTQLKQLPIGATSIANVLSSLTDIVRLDSPTDDDSNIRRSTRITTFNESYRRLIQTVEKLDKSKDHSSSFTIADIIAPSRSSSIE